MIVISGTPRKRPSSMHGDSPLSGCGAEQGAASGGCSSEQEASEMFSSRRGSTLASRPSYEAQARSSSSWEAQPVSSKAALDMLLPLDLLANACHHLIRDVAVML